ncbi:hypothetical protein MKW94_019044 [Papaver nudicaule]|uniref:Uncharacterized protein n=1 Tax=Papaver nudicaule TaxID=74823 RepID=A0AA41VGP5_PAPNU|nr:hypothetical protein [Papaver nudicaule]MCL7048968.1 hypothetical protein [Papaver nudicaule]
MSQPKPNPSSFSSPNSLSNWLKSRLPSDSFASWGIKPGTKNVHNLWLEISEGETSLLDSIPPVRTVNVVSVRVMKETVNFIDFIVRFAASRVWSYSDIEFGLCDENKDLITVEFGFELQLILWPILQGSIAQICGDQILEGKKRSNSLSVERDSVSR